MLMRWGESRVSSLNQRKRKAITNCGMNQNILQESPGPKSKEAKMQHDFERCMKVSRTVPFATFFLSDRSTDLQSKTLWPLPVNTFYNHHIVNRASIDFSALRIYLQIKWGRQICLQNKNGKCDQSQQCTKWTEAERRGEEQERACWGFSYSPDITEVRILHSTDGGVR